MCDFDDLINDAENYENEEEADDYFIAEYNAAAQTKKRTLDDANNSYDSQSAAEKKVKAPGCLADYFVDTNEPFPQNEPKTSNTSSERQNNASAATSASDYQKSSQDDAVVEEKGPLCQCGISSMSKTTLKEGPNKNRKFWVRQLTPNCRETTLRNTTLIPNIS